jgi:hypothetical protein
MAAKILPPVEYLRECFSYDPESGVLLWKDRPPHHFKSSKARANYQQALAGKPVARRLPPGYLVAVLDRRPLLAHRVAYKLATGNEPPPMLDHVNGEKGDNRFANLRPADPAQNAANSKAKKNNSTGFRGVYRWAYNGLVYYSGSVNFRNKKYSIGYHSTPEAAHAAYMAKARELHGEFFNHAHGIA